MQELLDALLRYSRVETQVRDFVEIKLDEIVRTVADDLEVSIRSIGAQVEIGPLPVVKCDPKSSNPFSASTEEKNIPGQASAWAICKKIVERHRGAITAQSSPGKGSTFIIEIPRS